MKDEDAAATVPSALMLEADGLDETSRTLHELQKAMTVDDAVNDNDVGVVIVPIETVPEIPAERPRSSSLLLNQRVAEIANNAYRRASAKSQVLSRTNLAEIAMVRFDELEIGVKLGKGSFSDVHEITKITAPDNGDENGSENGDDDGEETREPHSSSIEVKSARILLTNFHKRGTGDCRYAVKFLRKDVRDVPEKYAVGTVDLVIEGMFLASLSHPNIIKVRGLPEGGVESLCDEVGYRNGYFLVLDRLYNTLSYQMYNVWAKNHVKTITKKYGFLTSRDEKKKRNKDLAERLKVALDMSAALKYLHSKNLLYRDLKPENLGFDVRGDIKLFDLGLVKELHRSNMDKRGNYLLSMAGTPRYMAPEVGLYQSYNLSADVYSVSMLMWEMLTLTKPFEFWSYSELKTKVFFDGERPCVKQLLNKKISALISLGWSQNPKHRPTMDQVYEKLKSEYIKLAPHTVTEGKVGHDRRRSTFLVKT